ncbi:hypothetical protein AB1K18_20815 [Peribacillus simplex]|uniref:hypothetical protein n=1 Tax=Peribacillus simplex TaxID=1478 RepID=UPI003B8B21A3
MKRFPNEKMQSNSIFIEFDCILGPTIEYAGLLNSKLIISVRKKGDNSFYFLSGLVNC